MKHYRKILSFIRIVFFLLSVRRAVNEQENLSARYGHTTSFPAASLLKLTTLVYFDSRGKVVLPKQRSIRPSPAISKIILQFMYIIAAALASKLTVFKHSCNCMKCIFYISYSFMNIRVTHNVSTALSLIRLLYVFRRSTEQTSIYAYYISSVLL